MFFERINSFRRSLAFRLTILYSGIFTVLIVAAFYVFYEAMVSRINDDGTSPCGRNVPSK